MPADAKATTFQFLPQKVPLREARIWLGSRTPVALMQEGKQSSCTGSFLCLRAGKRLQIAWALAEAALNSQAGVYLSHHMDNSVVSSPPALKLVSLLHKSQLRPLT